MRNTRVGTAPCRGLGVQPGAPGSASPREGRGEGRVEGKCWVWFPASRVSRTPVMWAVGDLASLPTQGAMTYVVG